MSADAAPSPQSSECSVSPPSAASVVSVDAIFARAERVFERRVDQLLQAKRRKAALARAPFNARKAKRDARTVAGREKLDALVRRLADLATVQQMLLGDDATKLVTNILDGAAAAALGVAALHANPVPEQQPEQPAPPCQAAAVKEEKECIETSSCSDDCSVGAVAKDDMRELVDGVNQLRMYHATESVVNFVLDCDDDQDCVPISSHAPDIRAPAPVPAPNDVSKLRRMNSAPACHCMPCDCVCNRNYNSANFNAMSSMSRARRANGYARAQPQSLPLSAYKSQQHCDLPKY
ncbi:hypothetical protein FGB62_32g011 [Gracilaria domingensis]|nr:hypothetical protein FGB62_32g011 [Gracilaria domingensis]